MARSKRRKKSGVDRKRADDTIKPNGNDFKCQRFDKIPSGRAISITTLFKSEDLHEISTLLHTAELDDSYAFLGAVALSRFDLVNKLLREKFPINYDKDGTTPLILAVRLKLIEMADFLIRRGADLCQNDAEGNNALLLAAQNVDWHQESFLEFWNKMKGTNIDINHANNVGHTILHCLVKRHWNTAIDNIVNHSVSLNINNVTSKGVTALMMACSRHQEHIIKSLLRSKANLLLEDDRGCTAVCYAIAYFVQKKMLMPNSTLEHLIAHLEFESSIIAYLDRRLDLLLNSPEENSLITLSTVITPIITFTVHCQNSGMEILLRLSIFKRIREALCKHLGEREYVVGLLGIVTEIVRHCCDCCCSYQPKEHLVIKLYDSKIPNLCVHILQKFASSACHPSHLYSVLLPLILTCYHPRMKYWLQKNFSFIVQSYKMCMPGSFPYPDFYPDDKHSQIVKQRNAEFKVLMDKLERHEVIYIPDESTYQERRKYFQNYGRGTKYPECASYTKTSISHSNQTDRFRMFQQNKKPYDNHHKYSVEVAKPIDKKVPGLNIICDEPLNRIKLLKRSAGKTDTIKIFDKECCGALLDRSPKENQQHIRILKHPRENETVDSSFTVKNRNHLTVFSKWQKYSNYDHSSTINSSLQLADIAGDMGHLNVNDKKQYDPEINSQQDYKTVLQELNAKFYNYLSKYDQKWQKDYEEGYPEAAGDIGDHLKLMETLPKLEACYWSLVTHNWRNLVNKLEDGLKNNLDSCKTAISELKLYLNRLETEDEDTLIEQINFEERKPFTDDLVIEENAVTMNEKRNIFDISLPLKTNEWGLSNDLDQPISILHRGKLLPEIQGRQYSDIGSNEMGSSRLEDELKSDWNTKNICVQVCSNKQLLRPSNSSRPASHAWNMVCEMCRNKQHSSYCKVTKYSDQLLVLNQISQENQFAGGGTELIIMGTDSEPNNFRLSPMGGVFGTSILALDAYTHQPLVIKSILKNCDKNGDVNANFHYEVIRSLLDIHCDHVVPYSHCLAIGNDVVLASPLCERNLGDYLMLLNSTAGFSEDLAHLMISQIVKGLNFLHTQNMPIVHGNLKPSNILADSDGNLRLSEFGLNEFRKQKELAIGLRIWWAQETLKHYDLDDVVTSKGHGTVLYVTKESDIQTCGMILHYLATGGVHPFGRYPLEIMINLNENRRPSLITKSFYISDLVAWMLDEEPKHRPTSLQVLRHVYVWEKDKQWKFLLTCAGISTGEKLSLPVGEFHHALDQFANNHKVVINWVGVIQWSKLTPVLDPLNYSDTISGLLALLRDTLPSSSNWFLEYFPMIVLTLYRLIENTTWINHFDIAPFFNNSTSIKW